MVQVRKPSGPPSMTRLARSQSCHQVAERTTWSRPLIGLGLLAFAGFLGTFYYQLTQTLLIKSAILTGTGLALLALRRLLPESEAPRA